jgi:hypothetical protein
MLALKIVTYDNEMKQKDLKNYVENSLKPVPVPVTPQDDKKETPKAPVALSFEDKCKQDWEANSDLAKIHSSFEAYVESLKFDMPYRKK